MKTVYYPKVCGRVLLCVLAFFLSASLALGQCAATYQDASEDGTNIYAWSSMTDNYTILYSGCAPDTWGNNFTHSDTAEATITSPSYRQSSWSVTNNQCAGCGAGYSRADASLAIAGEYDSFSIGSYQDIICTVAGAFFSAGTSFTRTPSQHTYPAGPGLTVGPARPSTPSRVAAGGTAPRTCGAPTARMSSGASRFRRWRRGRL